MASDLEKGTEASGRVKSPFLGLALISIVYASPSINVLVLNSSKLEDQGFSETQIAAGECCFWLGWSCASGLLLPQLDGPRKPPIFTLVAVALTTVTVQCMVVQPWVFAVSMFVLGGSINPAGQITSFLIQENLAPEQRSYSMSAVNVLCSIVVCLTGTICGTVTKSLSWSLETFFWYSQLFVVLALGPYLVPESPVFSMKPSESTHLVEENSVSAVTLLCGEKFMRKMAATAVCWAAVVTGYYGLTYSAGDLSPNIYLNMVLSGLVDLVTYAIAAWLIACFGGSVQSQLISFFMAAAALLICGLLPSGSVTLMGVALIGRFWLNVAFQTVYLLIVEVFPPELRYAAMGFANVFARAVGATSPLLALLPATVSCPILGLLSLVACGCTTLLR